jgi:hypothetical protein
MRAWSPAASERMRVRPASLQESTVAAWSPPSGLAQWQVGLPQRVLKTVDGAFDQLSMPENRGKLALILSRQIIQDLSLAAGEFSGSHGAALALHFTCCSHKAYRFSTTPFIAGVVGKVQRKVNDSVIYFFKRPNARTAIFMSFMAITEKPRREPRTKRRAR